MKLNDELQKKTICNSKVSFGKLVKALWISHQLYNKLCDMN